MSTAIIIPCYNESGRLNGPVLLQFLQTHSRYSFYLVDDGSSDDTLSVLNCIKKENSERVNVMKNFHNLGKAESVRSGMLRALQTGGFEHIGFLDADLSTSLEEFDKLNNYLTVENKKAVFASRLKRMGAEIDRTPLRHIIGRIFATLIGWTIKLPFYDTQCGAKVFHIDILKGVLETPFITKWLFDVEIIIRLKKMIGEGDMYKYVSEYPISAWKEVKGSKLSWKDFYRIPIDLLRIRMNYRDQSSPRI